MPLKNNTTEFDWFLSEPASDYNIALNIGSFERIQQHYKSINGTQVPVEFWALPENSHKARKLLKDDVYQQARIFWICIRALPLGNAKIRFCRNTASGYGTSNN